MLRVEKLRSGYGKIRVLHEVSLRLRPGEVVALLGRNGAGKSTLLKSIMGLTTQMGGEVYLADRPLRGLPSYTRAQLGLGYVPEERRIFPELSVSENLEVAYRGAGKWSLKRVFTLFPRLEQIAARRGGLLSGGEQQMLAVARTLLTNPKVLLLDEPTEGLAPILVKTIAGVVAELKATGMAILLAEQNLKFTAPLADRAYVLESGEVRMQGTMAELAQDKKVRELLSL